MTDRQAYPDHQRGDRQVTDTQTRLQELQETIERAQAEIAALEAQPMQKAIKAYEDATGLCESDKEIEAGLRAAYPHLKAALEDAAGWIAWAGGECPVPPKTYVQYRMRSGTDKYTQYACELRWNHADYAGDIVAYRVARP